MGESTAYNEAQTRLTRLRVAQAALVGACEYALAAKVNSKIYYLNKHIEQLKMHTHIDHNA